MSVRRVPLTWQPNQGGSKVSTKNQNRNRIAALQTLALLFAVSVAAGQNTLSVVRTTLSTIEVRFNNTDDVAGMQFSIQASGLSISDLQRSDRISNSAWIFALYQPNDSMINVVILGSSAQYLSRGEGSIARFAYRGSSDVNRVLLTKTLIASPRAESLQVSTQNLQWSSSPSLAGSIEPNKNFKLGQNFPNPFNPSTQIAYTLNKSAQVRLSVYDVTGREVSRLVDQYQFVGSYSMTWNSKDAVGGLLPSGVYFAMLQVDNEVATSKMILAK